MDRVPERVEVEISLSLVLEDLLRSKTVGAPRSWESANSFSMARGLISKPAETESFDR